MVPRRSSLPWLGQPPRSSQGVAPSASASPSEAAAEASRGFALFGENASVLRCALVRVSGSVACVRMHHLRRPAEPDYGAKACACASGTDGATLFHQI